MTFPENTGRSRATLPPVTSAGQLAERWQLVVDEASRGHRELWVLWFDADGRQLSVVVPVEGVDLRPDDRLVANLMDVVHAVLEAHAPGGWASLALARPGPATLDDDDRAWGRAVHQAATERGLHLPPLHVAAAGRVTVLRPDDLVGASTRA